MGTKTSKLPLMTAGQVDPANDYIPIVDASAGLTKRIKIADLTDTVESTEKLKAWTLSGAYSLTSATRDADDVVTTATVSWPDGSTGTFTRTSKNPVFLTIDSYTITHTASGKTITQPTVTRNASGSVTIQPVLTITV
jgi:hypothetical protein